MNELTGLLALADQAYALMLACDDYSASGPIPRQTNDDCDGAYGYTRRALRVILLEVESFSPILDLNQLLDMLADGDWTPSAAAAHIIKDRQAAIVRLAALLAPNGGWKS